ncbi:MAG: chorismate-binding protein [Cyclobacteriaceae bacterium]
MERTDVKEMNLGRQAFVEKVLRAAVRDGSAVACWRLPSQDTSQLLISNGPLRKQQEITLEELPGGFVVAPFDPRKEKYFLPADHLLSFSTGAATIQVPESGWFSKILEHAPAHGAPYYPSPATLDSAANPYEHLVEKSLVLIGQGVAEKIVPSRSKTVALPPGFQPAALFDQLCSRYPHAMVSLISTPETGTWIGATPELLVSVDDNQIFRTVALAGTQPYVEGTDLKNIAWTQKDIEEQALVERYIISCLKKIRVREFDEIGPKTSVAGNLMHLKTEFTIDMGAINFPQLGSVMLKLLHPTSAVCGSPLEVALDFLTSQEGYDRQLYAGYLGPVNLQQRTSLFVNLRCLRLQAHTATLFAGAGVTSDSQPAKEFEETEMKMNTLLKHLQV